MELQKGPVSIFSLVFNSLKIANQTFGSALATTIYTTILQALLIGCIYGIAMVFGYRLAIPFVIIALPLVYFLTTVLLLAITQLIAAKIEKVGLTFMESWTASLLPALYFIIAGILLALPVAGIQYVLKIFFSGNTLLFQVVSIAIGLIYLPFIFTPQILALRGEGPLESIMHSWKLASVHYLRVLFTVIILGIIHVIFMLACVGAFKALLPVFLAHPETVINSKQLFLQAPWLFIGLAILYAYLMLFNTSVLTGLFLSLDYGHRAVNNREQNVPLEALQEAPEQTNSPLPPIPAVAVTPEIEVKQASVQTQTDEHTDLHLGQVYSAQDHVGQVVELEEDRMPTILFDEDMARQLAENERKMQEQQDKAAKRKEDEENGPQQSIRISKRPM